MSGLIGQLVGLALIYFTFKLIKRHADRRDPKHSTNGNDQRRTPDAEREQTRRKS
jgi:hypothetical protein